VRAGLEELGQVCQLFNDEDWLASFMAIIFGLNTHRGTDGRRDSMLPLEFTAQSITTPLLPNHHLVHECMTPPCPHLLQYLSPPFGH
jgi:hypothetical protein